MRDSVRQPVAEPRAPRRARRGFMGALVPRGRAGRILLVICLALIALGGVAALTLYVLIATGTVTANIATPYIERALEDRLGSGNKVSIGSTTIQTVDGGATAIVVHDIKVVGPDGQLVASAPTAEVELEGSLLSLTPRARRIDLVGAEMMVRIAASGHLAVSAGPGGKPILPGRINPPPPDPAASQAAPQSPASSQAGGAPASPASPAVGTPAAGTGDPLVLKMLARWVQELEQAGFDGGALASVGLKDGTLVVENESSGRRIVFQHIGVRLARPKNGGAELTFTSQGPHGVSTAVARIGPAQGGARAIEVVVKDVSTRDLVQAFSQDHRRFYMDTPLNANLTGRLGPDGQVEAAAADVWFGAGAIGNGEAVDERFIIDGAHIRAVLDPARRIVTLDPIIATKNENRIALKGEVTVPAHTADPWPFVLGPQEIVLAGEMKEPRVILDQVKIAGHYLSADKRLVVEQGFVGGPTGSMTFTSALDFGIPEPMVFFDATTSSMPVATLKRVWPVSIAPPARQFMVENVSGGTANPMAIKVRMPMALIGQKQIPLPENAVDLKISGQGVTVLPVKGLPPIANAKLDIAVTGRSVRIAMPEGTVVTPQNRKLAVSDGIMLIPDYFPREPTSQITVKFDGPADAGIEILGMEPLKGPTGTAFDPSTTRGRLDALLQVNITFRKEMKPEDIDYSFEANLTDFGVDKVFKDQRLEGATVKAFASPAGVVLRGNGKLAGAPIAFEYEKKKDVADADIRVNANLDDAARKRLGFDVPGVSGTVSVKMVGTTDNKDTKASLEVDLTAARILDLIPGLSKPPGKPLKARFTVNDHGRTVKLDDLVLEGSGTLLKGSLEFSDKGELLGAQFPTFQISDGDKASLRADKAGDVLKVRIQGEVLDARGILRSLVGTPAGQKRAEDIPDLDLEAKVGALAGNNGEVLRQFELRVSRRGTEMRDFVLTAKAGRDGVLAGEMRTWQGNKRRALHVSTSDAGAVLRFLDIYSKVLGGEAWLVIDPPGGGDGPQEGVLHVRDFAIKGEPGLDRLASAARDSSGKLVQGSASFEKAQAQFARTTGKIVFRDGAIWGPSVGATFDGTLDFAADRMGIRGTFVPAYGLNNMFSKLPVIGLFLGGGPNEGLLGVTFEIVGPMSGPTLRINPMSAVAPGFLRKIFEFRDATDTPPTR